VLEGAEISVSVIAAVVGCELECDEGRIGYKIPAQNFVAGDMVVVDHCAVVGNMVSAIVVAVDAYEVDLSLAEYGGMLAPEIHIQKAESWWGSQDALLDYEVHYLVEQMYWWSWK
jgi:hypothetical protein